MLSKHLAQDVERNAVPRNAPSGEKWFGLIGEAIVSVYVRWRREQEIRNTTAMLAGLDDRSLRDLGIRSRFEIEQVVRHRKEC